MSNILFIHGAGPNNFFGGHLEAMRNATVAKFGNKIYAPPAVDYTERGLILRYLDKWKDVQIIVGLSCGCSAINAIAASRPSERIPYAMYCSPSWFCGVGAVPPNVLRATQVSPSWDGWNPFGAMLVQPAAGNRITVTDRMNTDRGHVSTPTYPAAVQRLFAEVERTLK